MEVPGGISLETYASISAALAEGDRTQADVLGAFGLTGQAWTVLQVAWNGAIAGDEMVGDGAAGLAEAYGTHFARAQDALAPVPDLLPEQWAEIVDDVARHGLPVLPKYELTEADHARLTRRWTAVLTSDGSMSDRYNAAMFARGKP